MSQKAIAKCYFCWSVCKSSWRQIELVSFNI